MTLLTIFLNAALAQTPNWRPVEVFDQTTALVTKNFYDPTFKGLPWNDWVIEARKSLSDLTPEYELVSVLKKLLARLRTSHTDFLSNEDPTYFALHSIFSGDLATFAIGQVGAWFQKVEGKWFVRYTLDGVPNGLLRGDEIVGEFSPLDSLKRDYAYLTLRRENGSFVRTLKIPVRQQSFSKSFVEATEASYRVLNHGVAYFHLWAGTHGRFEEALRAAARRAQADAQAMILDLRDGFGGADPQYFGVFDGPQALFDKPLVVLINEGTRSGKEWMAHLFKKSGRAKLVGSNTAGFVLAGRLFEIVPKKFSLYLAVAQGPEPDLEGKGVAPDFVVPMPLEYSAGADPQLEKALDIVRRMIPQR